MVQCFLTIFQALFAIPEYGAINWIVGESLHCNVQTMWRICFEKVFKVLFMSYSVMSLVKPTIHSHCKFLFVGKLRCQTALECVKFKDI